MAHQGDAPAASSTEKDSTTVYDVEVCYDGSEAIPSQYRGSVADQKDMQTLGKTQVLWRNFRFFTSLAFASTVMCSWEYVLPLFVFGLTNGGPALIFWGFIVVAITLLLVYASLAELASMSPTAGGQYHWVSELTPPRWQKPLSYIVGWLTAIGWQVYCCSASFITGTIIQGLIALNVHDYVWHNWHGTLLTIAVVLAGVFVNTIFGTKLPLFNGSLFVIHLGSFIAVFVTLWVLGARADARILITFQNNGGWPTTGLSAMVGLLTPLSTLVGSDCSVHMSEEIQDASVTLPRAMMISVAGNMTLVFLMAVALVFTTGNVEDLLNTITGQPFIQLFYNITQSYVGTNLLTTALIVMLFGSAVSQLSAASRQLWSFARDNGVPGAGWLSKVMTRQDTPLAALLVSVGVTASLSCINLGSTVALNAMISLGLVAVLTSYLVTLCCLIWRRLSGPPLPPRRWSLGKWGLAVNVGAVTLLFPLWIFMFWPVSVPVTAVNMNWSSTIFCGLIIFSLVFYAVRGRHVYSGPVVQIKRDD